MYLPEAAPQPSWEVRACPLPRAAWAAVGVRRGWVLPGHWPYGWDLHQGLGLAGLMSVPRRWGSIPSLGRWRGRLVGRGIWKTSATRTGTALGLGFGLKQEAAKEGTYTFHNCEIIAMANSFSFLHR